MHNTANMDAEPGAPSAADAPPEFALVEFPPVLGEALDPGWDLGVAAQYIVLTHFRDMLHHRSGVWRNQEVEAVHQIRVAARRCRTALQTLGTLWEDRQARKFSNYLAAFAEKFNVARDLDVLLLWLDEQLQTASEDRAAAYHWLKERNAAKRAAEQPRLEQALLQFEESGFALAFVAFFSRVPSDLWALAAPPAQHEEAEHGPRA